MTEITEKTIDNFGTPESGLLPDAMNFEDEMAFGGSDLSYGSEDAEIKKLDILVKPSINQGNYKATVSACTMMGPLIAIFRNLQINLPKKEQIDLQLRLVDYAAKKHGYIKGKGWRTHLGAYAVKSFWNEVVVKEYGFSPITYFTLNWEDPRVEEYLKKGYFVGMTYTYNWYKDKALDGIVDGTSFNHFQGHITNVAGKEYVSVPQQKNPDLSKVEVAVYDSYYGSGRNEYYIKHFKELARKPGISSTAYIFIEDKDLAMYNKIKKKKEKVLAYNSVISALSMAYTFAEPSVQEKFAELAKILRTEEGTVKYIDDVDRKTKISLLNQLSFLWQFQDIETKKKLSNTATYIRQKYNIKAEEEGRL